MWEPLPNSGAPSLPETGTLLSQVQTASGVTHVSDHGKSRATSEGLCFRTALYVKQFFWSFANKFPEVILWIDAGNLRNKRDLNLCFEKSNYKVKKEKGPFHNMVKNKILNFTHYP